jgi:hypothetical protein
MGRRHSRNVTDRPVLLDRDATHDRVDRRRDHLDERVWFPWLVDRSAEIRLAIRREPRWAI